MIDETMLAPYLLYSTPIPYKDKIVIYPVTMENILEFRLFEKCLTIRKNSWFPDKKIIKMSYLDFLLFCMTNPDYLVKFNNEDDKFDDAGNYYLYFYSLLKIVCKDNEVSINKENARIYIDNLEVDDVVVDDFRRILIIQNGIDFNIDEFVNYATERALRKAKKHLNKNADTATIEDYIDSLMIALHYSEEEVKNLPIRKFWRLIERVNMHETYTICKTGESSGFVSFKEPIKHWMISSKVEDEFSDVKIDDKSLRNKIG